MASHFPAEIDAPLVRTLADTILPDDVTELDSRIRAVEAKVGVDDSQDTASIEARLVALEGSGGLWPIVLALCGDASTTSGTYESLGGCVVDLSQFPAPFGKSTQVTLDVIGALSAADPTGYVDLIDVATGSSVLDMALQITSASQTRVTGVVTLTAGARRLRINGKITGATKGEVLGLAAQIEIAIG